MFKIIEKNCQSQKKSVDFPKLMKSNSGMIVFMTENERGVALNHGYAGTYRVDWMMYNFSDYNESTTIQNVEE